MERLLLLQRANRALAWLGQHAPEAAKAATTAGAAEALAAAAATEQGGDDAIAARLRAVSMTVAALSDAQLSALSVLLAPQAQPPPLQPPPQPPTSATAVSFRGLDRARSTLEDFVRAPAPHAPPPQRSR